MVMMKWSVDTEVKEWKEMERDYVVHFYVARTI